MAVFSHAQTNQLISKGFIRPQDHTLHFSFQARSSGEVFQGEAVEKPLICARLSKFCGWWRGWRRWRPRGRWWYSPRAPATCATRCRRSSPSSGSIRRSTRLMQSPRDGRSSRPCRGSAAAPQCRRCSSVGSWWAESVRSWASTSNVPWSPCSGQLVLYGFEVGQTSYFPYTTHSKGTPRNKRKPLFSNVLPYA